MRNLVVVSAFFLIAGAGFAQEPAPAPVVLAEPAPAEIPTKVATLFAQNAITSTQEGQKASAALEAKFAPRKNEYERKQRELLNLRDQLRRSLPTISAEGRQRLEQAIDAKTKETQRLGEDSQAAFEEEEGTLLQELGEKLTSVVADYAQRNGYAAVVDVSSPRGPVLWASPSVDITSEVVKLYDQLHPLPPPAPPVSPTAPVRK